MDGSELGAGAGSYWAQRVLGTPDAAPLLETPAPVDTPALAERLLAGLLQRHAGQQLEDVYPVVEVPTSEGPCPAIITIVPDALPPRVDPSVAHDRFASALELVFGIGPVYAERFRRAGLARLEQLAPHPIFGPRVNRVLEALHQDPRDAFALVRERTSPSDPLLWWTTALFAPEDILFVDIETLGFYGVAVILIGVAEWADGVLRVTQYVARSVLDEPALLTAFSDHVARKPVLVSYNGRSFDWPTLEARAAYYGMHIPHPGSPHYDLLHFARRCWRESLPDFHATTVEREVLGVRRVDDLPGSYVPAFYEHYSQENNVGPLVYVVDHNRQDMEGMARIFARLSEEWTLRVG